MTEEKNIDASKQENQPQDKSDKERLNDNELNNVAGGTGGEPEIAYFDEPLPPQIFVSGK